MTSTSISPSPPNVQLLLPPFLTCLSAAHTASSPPSAVLPLLDPVLSQRVQLLSESANGSPWLSLLNWDDQEAAQLARTVDSAGLEPHPISGEVEIGETEPTKYRRIDEETLQALVNIQDAGLAVVYVWGTHDDQQAWRIAELKPLHGNWSRNPTPWETSVIAAEDAFESKTHLPAVAHPQASRGGEGQEEEEDDDYWARYDTTPSRTPARTPAKEDPPPAIQPISARKVASAEDSYWRQYSSVQPALDSEDPDEREANREHLGESSLDGNALMAASVPPSVEAGGEPAEPQRSMFTPNGTKNPEVAKVDMTTQQQRSLYTPNGTSTSGLGSFTMFPPTAPETRHSPTDTSYEHIEHPRPQSALSSNSSRSSRVVEHLEEQAQRGTSPADLAIQQHISTTLKSLYRLAKGGGMDRAEFERIVSAEMGVLSMMDDG